MALSWTAPKDPDEIKDYVVNWSALLDTDTISLSTWILPVGITSLSESNTDTAASIFLTGGTAGETYLLNNRIVTDGGRTYDRTLKLKMKNL